MNLMVVRKILLKPVRPVREAGPLQNNMNTKGPHKGPSCITTALFLLMQYRRLAYSAHYTTSHGQVTRYLGNDGR